MRPKARHLTTPPCTEPAPDFSRPPIIFLLGDLADLPAPYMQFSLLGSPIFLPRWFIGQTFLSVQQKRDLEALDYKKVFLSDVIAVINLHGPNGADMRNILAVAAFCHKSPLWYPNTCDTPDEQDAYLAMCVAAAEADLHFCEIMDELLGFPQNDGMAATARRRAQEVGQ